MKKFFFFLLEGAALEILDKARRASLFGDAVKVLQKKNRQRIGVEELARRYGLRLDLWTGLPLPTYGKVTN